MSKDLVLALTLVGIAMCNESATHMQVMKIAKEEGGLLSLCEKIKVLFDDDGKYGRPFDTLSTNEVYQNTFPIYCEYNIHKY